MCKEFANSPEVQVELLKCPTTVCPITNDLPEVVTPKDFNSQRQWYLYEQIRPFCHSNLAKDISCPKPTVQTESSELISKSGSNPCEDASESVAAPKSLKPQEKTSQPLKSIKRQKMSDSSASTSILPKKKKRERKKKH